MRRAAHWLRSGGVVGYPTEAVYGLGCDPFCRPAVQRVLALKGRPAHKGLIVIAATFAQLAPFVRPLEVALVGRALATWPGPTTWLWPARPGIAPWLRGRHGTVAVRVTAHPVCAALCQRFGGAIVSTSANLSGRPPARDARRVRRLFGRGADYVVSGPLGGASRPTEIRDLMTGRVVRPG